MKCEFGECYQGFMVLAWGQKASTNCTAVFSTILQHITFF
jgi:hypothetical protein